MSKLTRWQAYPEYKDSSVEWLGETPAHWGVRRLKYLTKAMIAGPFGSSLTKDMYVKDGYRVYGQEQVIPADFSIGDYYITEEKYHEMFRYAVVSGDVLVSCVGTFGKVAVVPENIEPGVINPRLIKLIPNQKVVVSKYLGLLLKSRVAFEQMEQVSRGGTMGVINISLLSELWLSIPSLPEQYAIVAFLDREAVKIDALIAKKQRLIELLGEQRTALISHAVTKGLDPDVPMKDSGIEWLGEIPVHWEVKRLKTISFIRYGLGQPPREAEDGLPLLRATNIERGRINPNGLIFVDPNDVPPGRDAFLQTNEIIVVRSGAYTGDSAIIPSEYQGAVTGYDLVIRVREAKPKFISYGLLSIPILKNQIDLCRLRAAQPHLNAEELGNTLFFIPPTDEQEVIVDYLDQETAKIDALIAKTQETIEKLKEYRIALISAAVTGKIDVRETISTHGGDDGETS